MFRKVMYSIGLVLAITLQASTVMAKLMAYYPMNEGQGTIVADASGNGHDGKATSGDPTWVPGPTGFGKAILFDGSNPARGWINCGTWNPSAETGQLTVAFWVRWQGTNGNWQGVVAKRDDWDPAPGPMMWQIETNQTTGAISFSRRDSYPPNPGPLPIGVWTHFAVTFDGTTAITYLNGEEKSRGAFSFSTTAKLDSVIAIGCDSLSGYNGFNGTIDEVRLYDTALPQSKIQQLLKSDASTSSEPTPQDGGKDVVRDIVLSWVPGPYAKTHDVYFGDNFADVNAASKTNPMGVLVSPGQDANSYDLADLLTFGKTYYWRVDEVNAPPTNTVFKGEVWSFTAETYAYPITTAIRATASSQSSPLTGPINTINGSGIDANDHHSTAATQMWLSKKNVSPIWIQYELDNVYKLHEMWVWNQNQLSELDFGLGAKDVTIDTSTDGTTWTALPGVPEFAQAPADANYDHNTTVLFGGVMAKYVKLTITANWGGLTQSGLSEVRFFSPPVRAFGPSPASGATGVALDGALTWRAGREAAKHEVYLGTDPNALSKVSTVTDRRLALSSLALDYNKTYYWKVNEVNEAAHPVPGYPTSWDGTTWSFTTKTYALVDNFDTYDDKCNRIFWTWIDQYGYTNPPECSMPGAAGNGTGATVGNASAPYAEQTIVHGGSQSMPMTFSNTTSPYYSEAQREWSEPQAWTAGGANRLTLYVRGDAAAFVESAPGVILMNGLGADIYQMTDEFRYAYKQLTGDGSITARVDSIKGTLEWTKAGVMIRSSLNAGVTQVHMVATFGNRVEFMPRLTDGTDALGTDSGAGSITFPQWVRVTRKGNTFTGEYSADGSVWKTITNTTPATITMPSTVYIGLVVNSNSTAVPAAARFSSVSTTGNVMAGTWQLAEVGRPQVQGNTPENFYVAIQDSSGKLIAVNHLDPTVIATGGWEEWNVPLSSFTSAGINLSSVKKLIVGVGNRTAPKTGGSGKVYIDDIRLTRIAP